MAIKETIEEALGKLGKDQPEVRQAVEKLGVDLFDKQILPKDAIGLNEEMIEGMYSFGYRLYNSGKYDQAIQLFRFLMLLDPTQPKFMLGLAACFHMQKEYQDAAAIYMICSILDIENPIPHYHVSDCYIEMQQPDLASLALEQCILRCGDKSEYVGIKNRAQVMLDAIKAKKEV